MHVLMPSTPTQLPDRVLSVVVKLLLLGMQLPIGLRKARFATILQNSLHRILNLPGELPFFPTRVTDIEVVKRLISSLHPIKCDAELIRLGPNGDGGYLVPDDLIGIEACFSPGVSFVAGFEFDCAERGMDVFMADASVEHPPLTHSRFHFSKKFVGATTQGNFITLEDWVRSAGCDAESDLLLQMDIEGYEYETIISTPPSILSRFRIIIVEFHDLENLFSEPIFALYARAFEKLLATHACVHIHPNNFCRPITVKTLQTLQLAEFTFVRRDRLSGSSYASAFPHPLDFENTPNPPCPLPSSFFRGPGTRDES
jgi:hypothetical protein